MMRFYPKDQGLSAFLSELAAQRAQKKSETPPPIESAGGRVAGDRDSSPTHATPHQKFSAPQHEGRCSDHPDAPHGFNRNQSHTLGRYVCDCEGWSPEGEE